jgi:hypothetical protein
MYSHVSNHYPTMSLLRDWIAFFYAKQRLSSAHRANDIAYIAALSGNPAGS